MWLATDDDVDYTLPCLNSVMPCLVSVFKACKSLRLKVLVRKWKRSKSIFLCFSLYYSFPAKVCFSSEVKAFFSTYSESEKQLNNTELELLYYNASCAQNVPYCCHFCIMPSGRFSFRGKCAFYVVVWQRRPEEGVEMIIAFIFQNSYIKNFFIRLLAPLAI